MRYLVGNWKNKENLTQSHQWLTTFKALSPQVSPLLKIIVCMPFTDLAEANREINAGGLPLQVGAQDVSVNTLGTHTGTITASMLAELISFCLVGHSERRHDFGEDSAFVAAKAQALLEHFITPIICVDTPYLEEQVKELYKVKIPIEKCIFAYEPLAAIGTGKPAEPDDVEHVASKINFLTDSACPVIYGGSINESNLASFTSLPNIEGALVGSSSLDPGTFVKLISLVI